MIHVIIIMCSNKILSFFQFNKKCSTSFTYLLNSFQDRLPPDLLVAHLFSVWYICPSNQKIPSMDHLWSISLAFKGLPFYQQTGHVLILFLIEKVITGDTENLGKLAWQSLTTNLHVLGCCGLVIMASGRVS